MTLFEWKKAIDEIAFHDRSIKDFCNKVMINEGMHDDALSPKEAYISECVGLDECPYGLRHYQRNFKGIGE
ncbi:MAG: hypothetical protein GXP14_07395 [Gammaproteobacteria bacterium]|nr:hypothetical protein [Gammaproteobacteria bacterium]